jgi:hypothetical protein
MDMYYREFQSHLWLMTRYTVQSGQITDSFYNGSFLIDKDLTAITFETNNARMEVVRQVKEERRLIVYYRYRYLGGVQDAETDPQYFRLDLTSLDLFTLMQRQREGILGFEIGVVEVPFANIPGVR